jgi:hypothetical protein
MQRQDPRIQQMLVAALERVCDVVEDLESPASSRAQALEFLETELAERRVPESLQGRVEAAVRRARELR